MRVIKKHFSVSRFLIIGISLFLSKLMLLLSAYLLSPTEYNLFNKYYYTAALVITFGMLGFDYAFSREDISPLKIILFVVFQISFFTFILSFFDDYRNTVLFSASVFIYAVFIVFSNILAFRILFDGEYISYFFIYLSYSLLHIILIMAIPSQDYVLFFPFTGLLWAAIVLYISRRYLIIKGNGIKRFYKLAMSGFIINSSLSLGIVFIKYVVNNFFPAETANAFTFSWGIAAPVYYIGSLIEKYIYSLDSEKSPGQTRKSFYLLLVLTASYGLLMVFILIFIPGLFPSSVNITLLHNIFLVMLIGYSTYCVVHFPINGYLFKYAESSLQKVISISFVIIIVFFIVLIFVFREGITSNYWYLLELFFAYIFTLLVVKTYFVVKSR